MQWLTMLCLKDIKEQCNLTALPDTRSRGLSRLFICKLRRYINLAEFGDYILVLECDLDCEWS